MSIFNPSEQRSAGVRRRFLRPNRGVSRDTPVEVVMPPSFGVLSSKDCDKTFNMAGCGGDGSPTPGPDDVCKKTPHLCGTPQPPEPPEPDPVPDPPEDPEDPSGLCTLMPFLCTPPDTGGPGDTGPGDDGNDTGGNGGDTDDDFFDAACEAFPFLPGCESDDPIDTGDTGGRDTGDSGTDTDSDTDTDTDTDTDSPKAWGWT